MRKYKIFVSSVILVLFSIIVNTMDLTVYATPVSGVHEEYEEAKNQAEMDDLTVSRLIERIAEMNSEMIEDAELIERTFQELSDLEKKTKESEQRLEEYEDDYEMAKEYLYKNIQMEYESGVRKSLLLSFLDSESIMDFLHRTEYHDAVHTYIDERMFSSEWMIERSEKEKENLSEITNAKKIELEKYESQKEVLSEKVTELSIMMQEAKEMADSSKKFEEELEKKIAEMEEQERELTRQGGNNGDNSNVDYTGNGTKYYYEPAYPYTDTELTLMAGIIQAEAGSTSYPGMIAVGSVVMNRVASPRFDNTIEGVIYAKSQFEPVATGRLAVILANGPEASCYTAAKDVLSGKRNVPNYYFKAAWYAREHGIQGVEIGGNVFH